MVLAKPETVSRILMGPGPMDIHPRVYRALESPVVGHLDRANLKMLDRIGEMLRHVFGTKNRVTNVIPGTGTLGMEACVANLIEPGDSVLACVHGYFGDRIRQMIERYHGKVSVVQGEWGKPIDPQQVEESLRADHYKVITVVHAETSTGVLQPMDDIAQLCKTHGVMILLDTVSSLGGIEVKIDEWGVDAAYSCSQKCIGSPPGLAPVTFSERAMGAVKNRKHPVGSWYLDILLLNQYWGPERVYHHTSSSTLNYAMLESLLLIEEEKLENRFNRHLRNHKALVAAIEAMGLKMLVAPEYRLPTLNTVRVPEGVEDARLRSDLLENFNLEIGGGLGVLKEMVWRVGLMGYASSAENILLFISTLSQALAAQNYRTDVDAGLEAARSVLDA